MTKIPATRLRVGASVAALGCAALITFGGAGAARAQTVIAPDVGPAVLAVGDALFAPPLVVNTVYVARQVRPPVVWPVLGFALGAGGVALGLAFALPNASSSESNASTKTALGASMAVEGGLNVGMAVWALTLPRAQLREALDDPRRPRWSVAPLVTRDVAGRPLVGAALSVGRF